MCHKENGITKTFYKKGYYTTCASNLCSNKEYNNPFSLIRKNNLTTYFSIDYKNIIFEKINLKIHQKINKIRISFQA